MFQSLARLLATLLHAALVFGLAPLLAGLIAKYRARLLGRRGPSVLQPYHELRRLLHKTTLLPETMTELFALWPLVAFSALAAAALLIPGFCTGMLDPSLGDIITLVGLLALARAALLLAGLETGFGFGGATAARIALLSLFAEAILLVVLLSLALATHATTLNGIIRAQQAHPGAAVSLGFALLSLLAVALAENDRIPAESGGDDQEPAMAHAALALEYSGRYLLLLEYTTMLRLMLWISLIAALFFPFFMARAADPLTWPAGLILWSAKLTVLAAALSLFEVCTARIRLFRVPEFLGLAMLLGILSCVLLFISQQAGG